MKKIIIAIFMTGIATAAFADCFDECMSIKGCWHKGQTYSSYCGSSEVNCESECARKEETRNRKSFGAIAYSRSDGVYGYSHGQKNRGDAEELAMNYCKEDGKKCRAMVWFQNSCGAVAAAGRKTGWGHGDSEYEAQQKALKDCGKKACVVQVSQCSY